jgi:hydroxypyruvate reductase
LQPFFNYSDFIWDAIMIFENNISKLSLNDDSKGVINELLDGIHVGNLIKEGLTLNNEGYHWNENKLFSADLKHLHIIGFGKASAQMADAVLKALEGFKGQISGDIITKYGHGEIVDPVNCHESSHPVPDDKSVSATEYLLEGLEKLEKDTKILALVSGGASALMCAPIEGLELKEKMEVTQALLACGAEITEINAVRKHLSRVKGGRLAKAMGQFDVDALVISDVIGDSLEVIGSGPTAWDSSTWQDVDEIFKRYELEDKVSKKVTEIIQKGVEGEIPETPEQSQNNNVRHFLISSLEQAVNVVKASYQKRGYKIYTIDTPVTGLNQDAIEHHIEVLREVQQGSKPVCLISGGETTVELKGSGKGGRNMEFALELGFKMYQQGFRCFEAISIGTDGTDGPTDAAGGFSDCSMFERLDENEILEYLLNNDSYHCLEKTGGLIKTGPTGTNVNDLHIVVLK